MISHDSEICPNILRVLLFFENLTFVVEVLKSLKVLINVYVVTCFKIAQYYISLG